MEIEKHDAREDYFLFFLLCPSQGPRRDSGSAGTKKFWIPWRMTQKRISRKTSLAKYDIRKSGEAIAPLPPPPTPPPSSGGLSPRKFNDIIFQFLLSTLLNFICQLLSLLFLKTFGCQKFTKQKKGCDKIYLEDFYIQFCKQYFQTTLDDFQTKFRKKILKTLKI